MRPVLPDRGPLNRVSVFFRIILAIPAAVFYEIVLNGLTFPLLFVMWIVVLVRAAMPPPLYDAYAALLRYQARFHSWFSMLTSEYAWGMLGDSFRHPPRPPPRNPGASPGPASPGPAAPTAQPSPQPSRLPTRSRRAIRSPRRSPRTPPRPPDGRHRSPPHRPEPPLSMPPPSQWERTSIPPPLEPLPPWGILVLQGAARAWMIFAIVWGSIIFVGQNAVRGIGNNNHNNQSMFVQLKAVHPDTSGLTHVIGQVPTDL